MKTLDLRFHGKLTSDESLIFNTISFQQRNNFNQFVSDLTRPHIRSLDWWVQGPSSRNTFSSPLFHRYCSMHLLQHYLSVDNFHFDRIMVDSLALRNIFKSMLTDSKIHSCKVCSGDSFKQWFKKTAKKYLSLHFIFFRKILQLIIARLTANINIRNIYSKKLVLIDTFVIPGYANEDRWYGCLWDSLNQQQQLETFFVPTIASTPIKNMYSVYKNIRLDVKNYIVKEDFLSFKDVFYAINYKQRLKDINVNEITVINYDVSGVVREELDNHSDILTIVDSILTYQFIAQLKKSAVDVRLAIDWFEGQVLDKAWNMGFRTYFPNTKTVGYRAFESFPFYLCSYPIPIEEEARVIPAVIAVQGKGTINTMNEFMPEIATIVIPSFKSSHVWNENIRTIKNEYFTLLITLPISLVSTIRILKLFNTLYDSITNACDDIKIIIKPHPIHTINDIVNKLNFSLPTEMEFSSEKKLSKLFEMSNLLVTEASSTCLEAMASGLSVIMLENNEGLTYDPIPKRIKANLYTKIRTNEQLLNAVHYYSNLSDSELQQQKIESDKIREDYFEPITQAGLDRFMCIDSRARITNA